MIGYLIGRFHSIVEQMNLRTVKDLPRVLERHLEGTQLRMIGVSVVIVGRDIQNPFLRE
jgi:hypothetical protein